MTLTEQFVDHKGKVNMRLKLTKPLLFFDLETTGVDTQNDRIVELAAVKMWPDGKVEEKCRRFNPLVPIPKEATAVHGISNDDVKNEPPFGKFVGGPQGIAAYFSGCDLGGYNIIHFDIPMLKVELERNGESLDTSGVYVVDAFKIFTHREPSNLAGALRLYCGKGHEGAHAALDDVLATIDVLGGQLERYPDLPDTVDGLDEAMRDPDAVDREGKLKWVEDEMTINFGRHKGRTLRYLADNESQYIRWMIDNKVVGDAVSYLRDALVGHFAKREKS